jgi:hypothetical protein
MFNLKKGLVPWLLLVLISPAFNSLGQGIYFNDAIRFSTQLPGATARLRGLGGASYALGGDIGNAALNPAGLGFIRKSQFSFSPNIGVNNAEATHYETGVNTGSAFAISERDNQFNLSLGQIGLVISGAEERSSNAFFGGSFSLSFNRLADFNSRYSYRGQNDSTDLTTFFFDRAQEVLSLGYFRDEVDFGIFDLATLGYINYVINPVSPRDDNFSYFALYEKTAMIQEGVVDTRGGLNQWDVAWGGNFNDRIYVGASLGIQSLRHNRTETFTEQPVDRNADLQQMQLVQEISTRGTGVNFTAGLIARVSDYVRVGLTATTPTAMRLTDEYTATLTTVYNNILFDNFDVYYESFLEEGRNDPNVANPFQYAIDNATAESEQVVLGEQVASTDLFEDRFSLTTPYRVGAGISVFAGKNGFVTADVEAVGYSMLNLKNSDVDQDFQEDNRAFSNLLGTAANLRLGAEYRLQENYRLRGGYTINGSPFRDADFFADAQKIWSAGAGYLDSNFYFDIAISGQSSNLTYQPYTMSGDFGVAPVVAVEQRRVSGLLTFGLFF